MELFPTTTAELIFFVVYALWLFSELVIGGIIPRSRRHGTPISYEDRSSRRLLSLIMLLSLAIAFLFAASGIASLPSGAFYLGIGLMIAGILLRQWSIAVLGRYFSRTVGVQEGQVVVDRGPYRLVRHPAYTGSLLTMVGLGFVLQSWGAVLVLIAFFGVAFGYRIHVEEAVLTSKLGDEYVEYAKKTKRLIPYVL
ncbi:MAG TPA: isoprenylcysteine carboxylmethyltransferase family protein [Candidatus Bathyarchaeia archaeon]|nr:isoprenylcysteine carboxylmethyltransferase family protein [Candidatus Bathyarchaeia archaeon]